MNAKINAKAMTKIALFTALIAVGAFIKIPIPVMPFTLQFLFTMLAGLLLGGKQGAAAVLCYIFIGLIGLPIFAEGGGISYVFQPTFGYLIGFVIATYVTGTIANKTAAPSIKRLLAANFIGLVILYVCGMVYYWLISTLYIGTDIGFWTLFLYCFVLAVPGDIFLCFVAAFISKRLIPALRNL